MLAADVPPLRGAPALKPLVIAGGGLAGAAAACGLAQSGRRVTVYERSIGPTDKICGEFLSAEAQHYLTRLGLDLHALGGHEITQVRLVRGARIVQSALPFRGLGLSRRILDEALLHRAAAVGASVRRGQAIPALSPDIDFLATGKHDIRDGRRQLSEAPEELVGFKLYLRLTPAETEGLANTVEVILFDRGYAGLQLVEAVRANLCLLVHRSRLAGSGGSWPTLLEELCQETPHLQTRLAGSESLLDRPLTIARVPYGFLHQPQPGETVYRLGDQACVIPSFSGDGMSMALHSAALAVQCHLRGESPSRYHTRLHADVAGPIKRAMALYRLGRSRLGQATLMRGLSIWPGLMRAAATATRVAEPAWISDR